MSDVNANIRISVDSTQALSSLRSLQNQISAFNKSLVASNSQAAAAQASALSGLTAQIGATKQFSTSIVNVESSMSRLGNAIDKNKLSMGEYFRYGTASTKTFGRMFGKEHTQIMDLAADRVKRLQTQYIALSATQNGMTKAMAVRPLNLFNADAAVSIQRQQIFNKLLHDGSTSILNFGKNTQWSGRQLMVGFTVPLTIFGGIAAQIFMDLEKQVVNFRRVYGDAMTPSGETDQMVEQIKVLGEEFTKYGIAVKDTVGLAADIAAAGAQGDDLVAATAESTRLATLGMIEMNQAMTATMALQTAFRLSNEELTQSVDFLNAVENQTVLSLDDVTVAIPKVAPIIKGLGGDVQDLAIFLTAMREGGVNAAEGANALKSGLASLISPTKNAREQLEKVGINIDSILSKNKGDIRAIVTQFGSALGELEKFERQQTLATVFGKYQFARLGALFENISRDGSQAQRVVDLTGQSIQDLAALSEKELEAIENSIGVKFTGAIERLKLALAPVGEVFLKIATPIVDFATKILNKFNELSPGVKQFISVIVAGVGVVAPAVIMLVGLFGNFIGQALKGFSIFNNLFNRLRGGGKDLGYLANEELDAAAAAASLEGKTTSLTAALNVQRSAVLQLSRAYRNYSTAANVTATSLPQGFRGGPARRMAAGGVIPGSGNKDTEPALLTPGEFVMNRKATERFGPVLDAMNSGSVGQYAKGSKLGRSITGGQEVILAPHTMLAPGNTPGGFGMSKEFFENSRSFEESLRTTAIVTAGIEGNMRLINSKIESLSTVIAPHTLEITDALRLTASEMRDSGKEATHISQVFEKARPRIEQTLGRMRSSGGEAALAAEGIRKLAFPTEADYYAEGERRAPAVSYSQSGKMRSTEYRTRRSRSSEKLRRVFSRVSGSSPSDQMSAAHVTPENQKLLGRVVPFSGSLASLSATETSRERAIIEEKGEKNAKQYGTTFVETAQKTIAQGDATGRGLASEAGRSSPHRQAKQNAKEDANAYVNTYSQAVESGMRKRRSASRPQGPAGIPNQTLVAQIAEDQRLQRQSQRGSRGAANREGDLERRERDRISRGEESSRVSNVESAQNMAIRENINRDHDQAIIENTQRTREVNTQLIKNPPAIKRFGSALAKGSGKIMGAMFALDGLVFGLSMMDNSVGEFAQKIMPVVFGIQGIAMTLPMVSGGITALAGALSMTVPALLALVGPIALVALAFGGVALLAKIQADKQNEAIRANQKYIDATLGGAASMTNFAKATNKQTILEKESSLRTGSLGVTEKQKDFAEEFVANESGTQILESIKLIAEAPQRIASLRAQLIQAMAAGFLSPKQAKAVARQVSIELGDPILGQSVVNSIDEALTKDGKRLRGSLSAAFAGTIENIVSPQIQLLDQAIVLADELAEKRAPLAQKLLDDPIIGKILGLGVELGLPIGGGVPLKENMGTMEKEQGGAAFQILATNATKFREAIALLNIEQANGSVTQEEYNERSKFLSEAFTEQTTKISNLKNVLVSGEDAVGGFFLNYATMMGMTEDQFKLVEATTESIIKNLKNVPETLSTDLKLSVVTGGMSLEQLINLDALFNLGDGKGEKNRAEFELLINNTGNSTPEQAVDFYLLIAGFEDEVKKTVTARFVENGIVDAENYLLALNSINSLPPNLRNILEPVISGVGVEGLKTLKFYLDGLSDIPKKQTKKYLILIKEIVTRQDARDLSNLVEERRYRVKTGSDAAAAAAQAEIDAMLAGSTADGGDDGDDGDDDGGSSAKSFVEQLISDTQAELALFPKMLNKLKGKGIPQQIIEMIGGGEEGLKKAQELLGLNKTKLMELIKNFNKTTVNEALKSTEEEGDKLRQKNKAISILMSEGMSREDATSVSSDAGNVDALLGASEKEKKKLIKGFKEFEAIPEFVDPLKDKLEGINKIYEARMLPLQANIDKQIKIVELIQEEIDALKELNDSDQDRTRALERQKEMIQRQIDEYERANELDQRRIDTLQRQDELRNRESDALSHELDVLSDMEAKIKDAYQERIDALTKVSKLNDDILAKERDQLGVSQALAEGDIFAATAAAQQMRQNQIKSAQSLSIDALGQARDNSVDGLTTSGGLTRAQAEERIKQIKEQSYQTSLLARDIEDQIFNRNQLMIPLKDQQLVIDRQIRDISDTIYGRESLILQIQKDKLDPQDEILKNYNDQAKALKDELDIQSEIIAGAELLIGMTDDQIAAAGLLGSAYHEVVKQIKLAQDLARNAETKIAEPKKFEGKGASAKNKAELKRYNDAIAAIKKKEKDAVDLALLNAPRPISRNMGGVARRAAAVTPESPPKMSRNMGGEIMGYGMGGKTMKYSKGNVIGTGSRDSISAMLTPGEYVIRKAMVDKYGTPMFEKINQGSFSMPSFNTGQKPATSSSIKTTNNASINAPMYNNYSVSVNVSGTNASADEIANKTIARMKQMQNISIRSSRGY